MARMLGSRPRDESSNLSAFISQSYAIVARVWLKASALKAEVRKVPEVQILPMAFYFLKK